MREDGEDLSNMLGGDRKKGGGKEKRSNCARSLNGSIEGSITSQLILKKLVGGGRSFQCLHTL